ncbi:MAG: hypothetical protein V8Q75_03220 [Bacilli bacterium]
MIKEFTANGYKYVLAGPVLTVSKVKLNGKDISKYLSNQTKISWYDVSKNSGRDVTNADGTMVLNVINTKWRIDLVSRPLTEDEVVDFYSEIIKSPTLSVDFKNPFTKQWKTIQCYRGDRVAQSMLPYVTPDGLIELYNPASQAVIEL